VIRLVLPSLLFALLAPSQAKVLGGNGDDRKAAVKFLFSDDFKLLGSACIQYGAPTWKPEYEEMAEQAKGQSLRLGKNFWTTLNNSSTLVIGGTSVPAGAYYLGLSCDEKGKFSLLVLDAKNADGNGWTPLSASDWKADYTCPLEHKTSKTQTVDQLAITMEGDEQDDLEFKIAWGGHTLSAKMQIKADAGKGGKGASGDKEQPGNAKKQPAGAGKK